MLCIHVYEQGVLCGHYWIFRRENAARVKHQKLGNLAVKPFNKMLIDFFVNHSRSQYIQVNHIVW